MPQEIPVLRSIFSILRDRAAVVYVIQRSIFLGKGEGKKGEGGESLLLSPLPFHPLPLMERCSSTLTTYLTNYLGLLYIL